MSAEENKALARRFIEEAFNQGNLDAIDECLSPEWVQHDPALPEGGGQGLEHARQFVQMYRSAFPDTHITIEDQLAEGDKVATRWTGRGTHQGELMGISPTGNRLEIAGMTIDRVEGGNLGPIRHSGHVAAIGGCSSAGASWELDFTTVVSTQARRTEAQCSGPSSCYQALGSHRDYLGPLNVSRTELRQHRSICTRVRGCSNPGRKPERAGKPSMS